MKTKLFVMLYLALLAGPISQAQINLGDKAKEALGYGLASFTFTNADAAQLSAAAVKKMDSASVVAGPKDGYTLRLNRVFGKHAKENGLTLNYKVYLTKDINAFATADGSVRVFSGLMDLMDDNQLLAVIGHEIGHVANEDSKDAMKVAYRKAALVGAVSSQSDKIAQITEGQIGQIASALVDSKYSRMQESQADTYSYDFMKRNGYDVNAVASAFEMLANLSGGASSDFISKMLSSHPDPKDRAEQAKARAVADKLYKPYTQKAFSNKATTAKVPAKKPKKKK